jgi:actin-related protein 5
MSPDYTALLRGLCDPLRLRAVGRIIQFPFVLPAADERTEEEIARTTEKRREQGKKLQEMAAKARLEKVLSPNMLYCIVIYEGVDVTSSLCKRRMTCNT